MMDGKIQVESRAGSGSTFQFTATVGIADTAAIAEARGGDPDTAPASQTPRPLHILLTEDNAVNQRLALVLLNKQGHSVTLASNGAEALAALEREPFDLILMDVQMPVMDGVEALGRSVPGPERAAEIPIIALTAFAMSEDEPLPATRGWTAMSRSRSGSPNCWTP